MFIQVVDAERAYLQRMKHIHDAGAITNEGAHSRAAYQRKFA
jgi:hypothetical protein